MKRVSVIDRRFEAKSSHENGKTQICHLLFGIWDLVLQMSELHRYGDLVTSAESWSDGGIFSVEFICLLGFSPATDQ